MHTCWLALIQKQYSFDALSLPCDVKQDVVAGDDEICFKNKSKIMKLKKNALLNKTVLPLHALVLQETSGGKLTRGTLPVVSSKSNADNAFSIETSSNNHLWCMQFLAKPGPPLR